MRTIKYYSDNGLFVTFAEQPPFLFEICTSDINGTAQTERIPRQNGHVTIDALLEPLTINIRGSIVAFGNHGLSVERVLDGHMNMLKQCFLPDTFGTLVYTDNRGSRQLYCRPVATPTFGDVVNLQSVTFDIELVADNSYWETAELFSHELGVMQNLWRFPFRFPMRFSNYIGEVTINNDSGAVIEPRIEIYDDTQNVVIRNLTTQQQLTISQPILEGQKMVVDSRNATVELHERSGGFIRDVSNWVAVGSEFIKLVPGENKLTIDNETLTQKLKASLFYRKPFY